MVLPQLSFLLLVGLLQNVFFLFLEVLHAVAQLFRVLHQLFLGLCPYGKAVVLQADAVDSIDQLILLFLGFVQ